MKGIETQASIAMMRDARDPGRRRRRPGCPSRDAREASPAGPKRYSIIDLPIIQLTATGRQHEGQQEGDAEEFARPDLGVEQQRQAEGDGVFDQHGQHVEDHVESAFQK